MKKNTLILFIISIIILIFAILFFIFSTDKSNNNTSLLNINKISKKQNEIIENKVIDNNEISSNNIISETPLETEDENFSLNLDYPKAEIFTFLDKENKEISFSDFSDKPTVILFTDFENELDKSTDFLSIMNSFYDKYKEKVNFLCIDKEKNINAESEIKAFKDIDGIQKYSITELPTLVFVNQDGLVTNKISKITVDSFDANMDLVLENY